MSKVNVSAVQAKEVVQARIGYVDFDEMEYVEELRDVNGTHRAKIAATDVSDTGVYIFPKKANDGQINRGVELYELPAEVHAPEADVTLAVYRVPNGYFKPQGVEDLQPKVQVTASAQHLDTIAALTQALKDAGIELPSGIV